MTKLARKRKCIILTRIGIDNQSKLSEIAAPTLPSTQKKGKTYYNRRCLRARIWIGKHSTKLIEDSRSCTNWRQIIKKSIVPKTCKKNRKTDFRNSNQNRQQVKAKWDIGSDTTLQDFSKIDIAIEKKMGKMYFWNSNQNRQLVKTKRDSRHNTMFKLWRNSQKKLNKRRFLFSKLEYVW